MKLYRVLQSQGFGSRKGCMARIRAGGVAVNGVVCDDPEAEVDPAGLELPLYALHTTRPAKTIDRIVNAFPTNQQEQIRIQLSTVLQAVISQLLLPRIDKPGRVAIFEIMVNTPSIAALIRDNKTFRIGSDIQTGAKHGMVTLDSFLLEKYLAGMIAREEVITKAQDPVTIQQKLQEVELAQAVGIEPGAGAEAKQ